MPRDSSRQCSECLRPVSLIRGGTGWLPLTDHPATSKLENAGLGLRSRPPWVGAGGRPLSKETLLEKSDFLLTPAIDIKPETLGVAKYGK